MPFSRPILSKQLDLAMHLWLHWVEWSGGLRTRHSSSPSIGDKTLDEVPEARIVFEEAPAWLFQYDTGIHSNCYHHQQYRPQMQGRLGWSVVKQKKSIIRSYSYMAYTLSKDPWTKAVSFSDRLKISVADTWAWWSWTGPSIHGCPCRTLQTKMA